MRSLSGKCRRTALRVGLAGVGVVMLGCGNGGATNLAPPPPPPPGTGGFEIAFSTYLGGNQFDEIREPRLLPDGRLLFGARTESSNMPVTAGVYQPNIGGGDGDSWIGILRSDGSALDAATFFGGSGMERPPYGLEKLPSGDIVFTSGTSSPNIPTTSQSFAASIRSPVPQPGDGYVCRITGDLATLRWCTYTSGGWPRGGLIADAAERLWVIGRAVSPSFVTTSDAIQTSVRGADDAFVMQLSADGRQALYSTRLGGTGSTSGESALSVRIAAGGGVYVSGNSRSGDFPTSGNAAQAGTTGITDGWALKLNSSNQPDFVTLVGGSGNDYVGHRSTVLSDGAFLLVGHTESGDLSGGGSQSAGGTGYLAMVSPTGGSVSYYLPAAAARLEEVLGPDVDSAGRIYLFGRTTASNLPVTADAIQRTYGGGSDGYLIILAPNRSTVEYATYIGGSGNDMVRGVAVTPSGSLFVVGRTSSDDFPVVGALQSQRRGDQDGFVMRLDPR